MIISDDKNLNGSESAIERNFSGSSSSGDREDSQITPDMILELFKGMQQNQNTQDPLNEKLLKSIDENEIFVIDALCPKKIKVVADKSMQIKTLNELSNRCMHLNTLNELTEKIKAFTLKNPQTQNNKGMLDSLYRGAIKMYKQLSTLPKTEEELVIDILKACESGEIQKEQQHMVDKLTQEKAALLAETLIPCLQKIWEEQELAIEQFKNEQKAIVAASLIQLTQSIAHQKLKGSVHESLEAT